jgi:3',5'-cyclic-AMP phosphodiesterase
VRDMRDGKDKGLGGAEDTPEEVNNGRARKKTATGTEPVANDGIDRRNFLSCMAWAGTGLLWTMVGGVPTSKLFAATADAAGGRAAHGQSGSSFSFVQISDSHIGFNKDANPDVTATLRAAIAKVNALPTPPAFVLHTGDLTQLSKAEEFDTLAESLKSLKTEKIFYVPGEHDVLNDNGQMFHERFGQQAQGDGWYSFDQKGAHFIGLVNVLNLKAGGLGSLGAQQLAWLEKDVSGLKSSTPIVVFAHIPLWSVYPEWGWGTEDSAQALTYLKKFGSVTVLNGHIHQTMQKVEGNITFHTACSTAFPQPQPGQADSPGPMKVPAEKLRSVLGITDVNLVRTKHTLGIIDSSLA